MASGAAAAGQAMSPMDIVDIDGKLELSQEFEDDDDLIGDEEDDMKPVGASTNFQVDNMKLVGA